MNNDDWRRGTREAENRAVSRTPMRDFAHLWNLSGINVTRVRGREERSGRGGRSGWMSWGRGAPCAHGRDG